MSSPNYETQRGLRPDLAAIEVNAPESYIGFRLYPQVAVQQKQGRAYYQTLTADSAAQTNRNAGEAPTRTLLTPTSATWTATEFIKRYGVTRSEAKEFGGIEIADKIGATGSKRSVMRAIEDTIATQALTGDTTDISGGAVEGLSDAAQSVKRYAGRLAFVCSHAVYRHLVNLKEITDKLGWTCKPMEAADILSLNSNVFINMLKGVFAFDEILIGDDNHWDDEGKAVVCKLPDPGEFSHKLDPVLGKTMTFYPDGEQPYEVESFYDDDDKVNNYDCSAWLNVKELNADAKVVVDGLSSES